jgi:hypothetical protein
MNPLIIKSPPGRWAAYFVVTAVIVIGSAAIASSGPPMIALLFPLMDSIVWLPFLGFGVYHLRVRVTVDDTGIRTRGFFTREYPWPDIEAMWVVRTLHRVNFIPYGVTRHIEFDFKGKKRELPVPVGGVWQLKESFERQAGQIMQIRDVAERRRSTARRPQ